MLSPKSLCTARMFTIIFAPAAPFRASGHKRYNTLDFPAENRVPKGTLSPLESSATKPEVSLDSSCYQGESVTNEYTFLSFPARHLPEPYTGIPSHSVHKNPCGQ